MVYSGAHLLLSQRSLRSFDASINRTPLQKNPFMGTKVDGSAVGKSQVLTPLASEYGLNSVAVVAEFHRLGLKARSEGPMGLVLDAVSLRKTL
jgi:hypothetical protein